MTFEVRVAGAAPAAPRRRTAEHADTSLDDSAKLDPNATPPADWKAYDPALAPAPGGREHQLTLTATEGSWRSRPGSSSRCGASRARSPARPCGAASATCSPSTLVNDPGTSSGLDRLPRVQGRLERRDAHHQPGEQLVYQFEAKHAGAYMYHCGTAPTLHHIGNGMYGAIVIDPPNLAKVDHEKYLLVSPSCTWDRRPARVAAQDAERELGRGGVQQRHPVQVPADRGRAGPAGAGLGAGHRPLGEQRLPHRRDRLRHHLQGGGTCCAPARAGAAPGCWTCSPPRAASSSSPSTSRACTRSSPTSSPTSPRAPLACSRPVRSRPPAPVTDTEEEAAAWPICVPATWGWSCPACWSPRRRRSPGALTGCAGWRRPGPGGGAALAVRGGPSAPGARTGRPVATAPDAYLNAGRAGQGGPVDPGDRQPERRLPGRLDRLRQPLRGGRSRRPGAQRLLRVVTPGAVGRCDVEWHYLDVVRAVRQATGIPLAVKLSPYFSSLANLAGQLVEAGAMGWCCSTASTSPTWTSRPWRCGRRWS